MEYSQNIQLCDKDLHFHNNFHNTIPWLLHITGQYCLTIHRDDNISVETGPGTPAPAPPLSGILSQHGIPSQTQLSPPTRTHLQHCTSPLYFISPSIKLYKIQWILFIFYTVYIILTRSAPALQLCLLGSAHLGAEAVVVFDLYTTHQDTPATLHLTSLLY